MGDFALPYVKIGRNSAQINAGEAFAFSGGIGCRTFGLQAGHSTMMGLQVQDRYPSPLKRSAHLWRASFFGRMTGLRNGKAAARRRTTNNLTNRVEARRCVAGPLLMQDSQPIGWARGDLT